MEGWTSHGGSGIGTTTNGSVTMERGELIMVSFTLGNLGACNAPSEGSVTNISTNSATLTGPLLTVLVSYDVDYKPTIQVNG